MGRRETEILCGPQRRPRLYAQKQVLEALFAGFAHFYRLAPFGVEDLVSADSAARVRVEDAIDDISAPSLKSDIVSNGSRCGDALAGVPQHEMVSPPPAATGPEHTPVSGSSSSTRRAASQSPASAATTERACS